MKVLSRGFVIDPETALGIEKLQRARIDGDFDRVTFLHARAGIETSDDHRAAAFDAHDRRRLAVIADVALEFLHVLGGRRLGVEREVHDDLRAERLDQLDLRRELPRRAATRRHRRVVEVLRADPEDHVASFVGTQSRSRPMRLVVQRDGLRAQVDVEVGRRALEPAPRAGSSPGCR